MRGDTEHSMWTHWPQGNLGACTPENFHALKNLEVSWDIINRSVMFNHLLMLIVLRKNKSIKVISWVCAWLCIRTSGIALEQRGSWWIQVWINIIRYISQLYVLHLYTRRHNIELLTIMFLQYHSSLILYCLWTPCSIYLPRSEWSITKCNLSWKSFY